MNLRRPLYSGGFEPSLLLAQLASELPTPSSTRRVSVVEASIESLTTLVVVLDSGVARLQVDQGRRRRIDRHGPWVHYSFWVLPPEASGSAWRRRNRFTCAKQLTVREAWATTAPPMPQSIRKRWWISELTAGCLPKL